MGADDDRTTLPEDQRQAEEDAQFEAVSAATVGPLTSAEDKIRFVREKKLLDEMTEIAEAARGLPDSRGSLVGRVDSREMCPPLESRLQPVSSQPNGPKQPKGWTPTPPTLAGPR